MSRLLRASILLLALASCGGGNSTAPKNMDDACAIVRQRPAYFSAMRATERKWGVPVHVQMAAIYQESKFIGDARTPHRYALGIIPMGRQSSAYGYSQALDDTWDEYRRSAGRFGAKPQLVVVTAFDPRHFEPGCLVYERSENLDPLKAIGVVYAPAPGGAPGGLVHEGDDHRVGAQADAVVALVAAHE